METPLLVVVSGPAATGKTSLARRLGGLTALPVICKDDIKETLFDSLGYATPEWVEQLETATYDLLFYSARTILRSGTSLIIESDVTSDFNEERVSRIRDEIPFDLLQIACRTDGEVLVARFNARMNGGGQHPCHYEAYYLEASEEFRQSLRTGYSPTLDLESEIVTVDTTDFGAIDYDALAAKISAH